VLCDIRDVVETTDGSIDRHIADGRVEKVASDFSEAGPPGEDAYLLKWIVHDWDDEAAIRILTNCRTAMAPTGKVLQKTQLAPTPPAWTRRCWSSPAAGNALRASTETCSDAQG
jgi:hypothetical protein